MDSFELNKVAGAILLAGVIAMLAGVLSRMLIPEPHMEESVIVATGAGQGAAGEEAAAEDTLQPIAPLLASASVEEGMQVARKCSACHTFEQGGANKVGPNLWNVVGAEKAHSEDFSYSSAMAEKEGQWTYADLNAFLADPREFVPGTKMSFAGLSKVEDRAAVVAYLRSLSENPQPLPEVAAEAAPTEKPAEGEAAAEGEGAPAQEGTPGAAQDAGTPGAGAGGQKESRAPAPEEEQTAAVAPDAAGGAPEGGSPVTLIKAASAEEGAQVARKCMACHTFEQGGANRVGPNLWDVVGAPIAHRDDYNYSRAMEEKEGKWTSEALFAYLEKPRDFVPGTKMTFAGLKKPEERAAMIAYMRSMSENPPPLE